MDFSSLVLAPNQLVFSKPITVNPLVSQPGVAPYIARGIWTVRHIEAILDDGGILTTRQLTLDVRLTELPAVPDQGDHIAIICDDQTEFPGVNLGDSIDFIVDDVNLDSGGAAKLLLKRVL